MSVISTPAASSVVLDLPQPAAHSRIAAIAIRLRRFGGPAALLLILALFSVAIVRNLELAINHPDANGYWAQGSLLVQTGRSWFAPESNAQYVGMHWLLLGENTFISRYPPGFPLLVGFVQQAFGWKATLWINPVLSVLTIVGLYVAVRQFAPAGYAVLAAATLAVNAAFAVHALTEISHTAVAFCLIWGIVLLLRWSATGRIAYVFAAGLVLGCIPSTRYADAIVALGVAAFLLGHVRQFKEIHWHYAAAIAGAAIPVVPLLVRNQLLMGAFWRTGYALTNEQTGFGWQWFAQHAVGYLQLLSGSGIGVMFALGLVGMVWMLSADRTRATGAMLLLMTVPFVLLYMAYYWARGVGDGGGGMGGGGAGSMRFMVPVVPVFILSAVWAIREALRHAPRGARVAVPIALLTLQTLTFGGNTIGELRRIAAAKKPLALATAGLSDIANDGDVIVANPALLQQLDFLRTWKLADRSIIDTRGGPGGRGVAGGGTSGDNADAPSPQQQAKQAARAKLYAGSTSQKQQQFQDDLVTWADGKSIYAVGTDADLDRLIPGVSRDNLKIVQRIPTPKATPDDPARSARGGRNFGGNAGPRGPGGPLGNFVTAGEAIVIVKWTPRETDMLSLDDFR